MFETFTRAAPPALDELMRRRDELTAIAAKHGASNLRVFGSVARGDQHEGSDLDLLVDIEPGRSLLDLGGLLMDLEEALGCRVDIGEFAGFGLASATASSWRLSLYDEELTRTDPRHGRRDRASAAPCSPTLRPSRGWPSVAPGAGSPGPSRSDPDVIRRVFQLE